MKLIIFSILAVALGSIRGQIPANFPKCHYSDEPCLIKAANEIVQKYYSGLPAINLQPFDPLHIKSIILPRKPSSPVNIETSLSDIELTGMKTMVISKFKGLSENLNGRTEFGGTIGELDFKGHYKIDGRVLILPIVGEGTATFKVEKIRFSYSFELKPVKKDAKIYSSLHRVKFDVEPEHVQFEFDNLFNGDKALTDTMNEFVNANWREIYNEMKPGILKATGLVIKSRINPFMEKYPYADYFLPN